jgi:hypothetical protein
MRRRSLLATLLCLVGGPATSRTDSVQTATSKAAGPSIPRALEIAFEAIKDRPPRWEGGCDIRVRPNTVRPGDGSWWVTFEPVPMGPGLDVLVVVRRDGSTEVAPGF